MHFVYFHVYVCLLQVTLRTDDMDLAGDLVQAVASFLGLDELQVTADFPMHMEELKEILVKVRHSWYL